MRTWYLVLTMNCLATTLAADSDINAITTVATATELQRAMELERTGDVRQAERVLLAVVRGLERNGASVELAAALNNLAVLYGATDRYADAERHFKRCIRMLEAIGAADAQDGLARAKLHLAALYVEAGRGRDAVKLNVPAILPVLKTPEDQARAKAILASLAVIRNDLAGAEQMLLEVLAFWREPAREAGSRAEIATILNNLGVVALWQGRTDLARERLEQSFDEWQRAVGPASPHLVKAMANVAMAYYQAKQYDEAVTWFARCEAAGRSTFGELHPFLVAVQAARAEALKKGGRKSEAREVARAASEARKMMRSPSIATHTLDYRDVMSLQGSGARR